MHTQEDTLAAPQAPGLADALSPSTQEFLGFRMGEEEYGIDILKVQEIRGYEQPTRMTGTPHFFKGVSNLRGVIVPILDLRLKFGRTDPPYDGTTVTVVLALDHMVVGIVVDAVSDVVELASEQIRRVPDFNGQVDSRCIQGIGTLESADQQRMLILLDIEKLMASSDMRLVRPTLQ